jgi:sugar O-acyltransferase (sialic acid O-acetyltransferase NeuD family)
VIGAGGHAKVVIATLQAAGFEVTAALDDDQSKWGSELLGIAVAGPLSAAPEYARRAVIAIGNNQMRRRLAAELNRLEWVSAIHPAAVIHPSARIGVGTVVFAGAVIQPDAQVGGHVIVNTAATIDHDCLIADFAHLAPGVRLAGAVSIGEGAMLSIGASVIPGVRVGEWSVVGAGSVVLKDVESGVTVVGAPAAIRGKTR